MDAIRDTLLRKKDLGQTLTLLEGKLTNAAPRLKSKLGDIAADYDRMADYVLTGGKDPQLESLYDSLLRRTYALLYSIEVSERRQKHYGNAPQQQSMADYVEHYEDVKSRLEAFVQEQALATLLPESEQADALLATRTAQRQYVSQLFDSLIYSEAWSNGVADFTKELLLSPSIDTVDAQQMISAITLSLLNVFDVNKWGVLIDVFEGATEVHIKQKAFVGWVLTLPSRDMSLFPVIGERVRTVCSQEDVRHQIVELQIQLYYCDNADKDTDAIQKEIIPTLAKNNSFRITKQGIVEKEEDELENILHPDAEERNMEEIEQSLRKMVDMQIAGSDIYFGGFSQMKRYPFFSVLSNWFCPFYIENPSLGEYKANIRDNNIMKKMLVDGPFCDSDKYSFAFATARIIAQMPPKLREMLNHADVAGMPSASQLNFNSPTYVRRMYLQDMYRFFRLNYNRSEFHSPFRSTSNGKSSLFLSNRLLADCLSDAEMMQLYRFLLKHKMYVEILLLDDGRSSARNIDMSLIVATAHLRTQHYAEAARQYRHVLKKESANEQALKGMAHVAFVESKYKEAAAHYEQLTTLRPESLTYKLNLAISLIRSGEIGRGMVVLFQLEYDNPDDKRVSRALAWGYFARGEAAKAEEIYTTLLSSEHANDGDVLNAAYAKWALSKNREAIELFRQYAKSLPADASRQIIGEEIESEKQLLEQYNISHTERKIMAAIV